jgi:hypothetical protein
MTRFDISARISIALLACGACATSQASTITDWNFGSLAAVAPDNTPAPTSGSGSATSLGMTNTFTETGGGGDVSTTFDDIVKDTSSATGNQDVWRIRGAGSTPGNGWSINAPEFSQGAQFEVSTVGFTGINLSFNWASTKDGIANLQVQYNTNVNNPNSVWTNVGPLEQATIGNGSGTNTYQTDTISLAGLSGVSDDANFGIRLVSAFNPTLGTYASASSVIAGAPADYNNNSGNWRFADVQVDGTVAPVPLPAAAWLLVSGLGGFGFFGRRRAS